MTAASVITLCNSALGEIGSRGIDTTADLSDPANDLETLCARHWRNAVLNILAMHDWKRLEIEAALTADTDNAPLSLYSYRLPFPTESYVARVVNIEPSSQYADRVTFVYAIQGESVISDESTAVLRYVPFPLQADDEDDTTFEARLDSYFASVGGPLMQCFILQLAARLVGPLTQNGAEKQRIISELELSLDKAKAADSAGHKMLVNRSGTIIAARFRGVSR